MGAAPSTQEYVASWESLLAGNVEETEEYLQNLYQGKELAKAYAAYRPKYPQAVFDAIMTYHGEVTTTKRSMALDVCCGPGQSTLPLVPLFEKVVGVDISQDLLDHMPKDIPNLTTYMCAAEDLFMIASDSVDLITSGAGLHWLNTEKFFKEAKRVLKPGGTFAAYMFQMEDLCDEEANKAYKEPPAGRPLIAAGRVRARDNRKRQRLVQSAYHTHDQTAICLIYPTATRFSYPPHHLVFKKFYSTMKDYLTSKTLIVAHKYETIDFPFDCLKRLDVEAKMEMTIDQFKGYMASGHFWPLYSQANPTTDILEDFMIRLQRIFGKGTTSPAEVNMKVYRKIFLVLGRNQK